MSEYKWNTDAFDAIRIVAANGEFEINGTDGTQVVLETMERNRHSFGSEPSIVGRWLYLNPFGGSSEMSLELPKSKAWTIEVACASGEVEIENVHARIGVQLGSGDVRLENCRGTFNLRVGSGDVRLENCVQSEVPQVPEQPTAEQQANMHNMPPGVPPMPPGAPPIPPIPPVPPIPGMGPMPGMPGMPPMPPGGFKVRMGRRGPGNGDNWEDYGREWEEWGERFGEQVSHWAENLTRSFSFGVDFGPDDQATGDGFHVRLGHGDVQFEDIDALVVSTRVGSGDVQIEQGRIAELDIENSRGDIQIEAVLPTGAWEVITRHGDVQLVLPGDAHVRIDAATRHGDIECEAPLVRVGRPGPGSRHGGRMVGTIGEGQGDPVDIHLESQHGDIQIELDRRPSRFQGQATQKGTRTERRANEPQSAAVVAREPVAPAAPRTATQPAPNAVVPVTITDLNEPEAALNAPPKAQAQVYDSQFAILQALQAGEITVAEAEMLLRSLH